MSDESVRAVLRSADPLVLIEAPAGCGKTHQGADYAREVAQAPDCRPLILTHTHAACSVFAERTRGTRSRVDIRTIDSVIGQVAAAYHLSLGLPPDPAAWLRQRKDTGHGELAIKVADLLARHQMISTAFAHRHRVVICDEHQDSSGDQHALVMALLAQGSKVRIFADPMQKIFREKDLPGARPACDWTDLKQRADAHEQLETPHRWTRGCQDLGKWTLAARAALQTNQPVDLRAGLPASVEVVFAENEAKRNLEYKLSADDRKPVDAFQRAQSSLLVLTRHNDTARSFRGFFGRQILLWEGHKRDGLEALTEAIVAADGAAPLLAAAVVRFMADIGKGFSASAFGDRFEQEVREGCVRAATGKPALIQELAKMLLAAPDHRGVGNVLRRIEQLKDSHASFADVEMDCHREFWDAVRLGDFETAEVGLAEVTSRRTYSRPKPPARAISNIYKAKGLECDAVLLMPCDGKTFPNKEDARCLLYVALSRAKRRLMLVLSRNNPSPLFTF